MAFNKAEIIKTMAEAAGIKKTVAGEAFEAFLDLLTTEEVNVVGYFATKVKDVEEKQGRNPSTGEAITIPAHKAIRFKVGKKLKDAFNQ